MPTRTTRSAVLALAVAVTTALAGCGGGSSDDTAAGGGGGGGVTVKAAQFSWSAAKLTNAIVAKIAKDQPDLGVKSIETTQLDPAAAWTGASRGDIEMLTEVALPNQQKFADSAKDRVSIVSQTYGDASQGWFVPKYVVDPGGPAAGLTSVTQLDQFSKVFDGKLYDADPGYVTTEQNTARLKGYGIDYEHVVAGEAAELAQLGRAYSRKEPIVLYLYHPHAVFSQYDMVQLTEPTPYSDGCLTTGSGACAMPAYSANIALAGSVAEKAPKFAALLKNLRIDLPEMEDMLKQIDVDKQDVESVASDYVEKHADDVKAWAAG